MACCPSFLYEASRLNLAFSVASELKWEQYWLLPLEGIDYCLSMQQPVENRHLNKERKWANSCKRWVNRHSVAHKLLKMFLGSLNRGSFNCLLLKSLQGGFGHFSLAIPQTNSHHFPLSVNNRAIRCQRDVFSFPLQLQSKEQGPLHRRNKGLFTRLAHVRSW